ncbi:MAG TPA: hypothetical protein VMT16_11760 [Thermoanaerobaculia bacterium]|nr:hypothetical protein [Thermoanaerobaculia bacterium]
MGKLALVGFGGFPGTALRYLLAGWVHRTVALDHAVLEGVATVERVEVRFYRSRGGAG